MKRRVINIILIIGIILMIATNAYAIDTSAYEDIYKNQGQTKLFKAARRSSFSISSCRCNSSDNNASRYGSKIYDK